MQISLILAQQIAELFLILLIGCVLVKVRLLKSADSRVLSIVMVYAVMPCVIINAFQVDYSPAVVTGLLYAFALAIALHALLLLLARLLRRVGKAALYPAVLVLVAAVQLFDLSAMIAEKHTAMAETAAKPQPYPQELVDCRDNYGTLMLADDIIHARNVICAAWHPGMVTNGYDVNTYTGAWNVTIDWTAQTSAAVDSGTLDPDTLYVTGDADRFASWQAQYGDKADYITWDIAATGIYDRRDEYYFMAPKQ